jgi:hypothetical protein
MHITAPQKFSRQGLTGLVTSAVRATSELFDLGVCSMMHAACGPPPCHTRCPRCRLFHCMLICVMITVSTNHCIQCYLPESCNHAARQYSNMHPSTCIANQASAQSRVTHESFLPEHLHPQACCYSVQAQRFCSYVVLPHRQYHETKLISAARTLL